MSKGGLKRSTYHVGCCQIVQQIWNTSTARRGYGDVEHSLCSGIRFLKRHLADVGSHAFLKDVHVEKVSFPNESSDPPNQGLHVAMTIIGEQTSPIVSLPRPPISGESRKVDAFAIEKVKELILGVDPNQSGNQCPRSGSGNDPR